MARRMKLAQTVARPDQRADPFVARIDARFDELKRHVDAIAEGWRDDRRKLHDLFLVYVQRMEERMDTLAVALRAEMKLGYDALDSRVSILERNGQARRRRR
jgi:hypothetical protein